MIPSAEKNEQPIWSAGTILGPKCHTCGFLDNPKKEYQLLLSILREGIDRGEKAFHVVDPNFRDNEVKRVPSVGIRGSRASYPAGKSIFCAAGADSKRNFAVAGTNRKRQGRTDHVQ